MNPFEAGSWGFDIWNDAQAVLKEEIVKLQLKITTLPDELTTVVSRDVFESVKAKIEEHFKG